jgi:hypothetical protein
LQEEEKILQLVFHHSNFQRSNLYNFLLEKYAGLPCEKLSEVMKLMTIAMMRPDISTEGLRVNTYKELADRLMLDVANRHVPEVLVSIERDFRQRFGSCNIDKFGDSMLL